VKELIKELEDVNNYPMKEIQSMTSEGNTMSQRSKRTALLDARTKVKKQ
jgi:hypothetical protein